VPVQWGLQWGYVGGCKGGVQGRYSEGTLGLVAELPYESHDVESESIYISCAQRCAVRGD